MTASGRVTLNKEGGRSYTQDPKTELTFATVTSLLSDSYYESGEERQSRISDLVTTVAKSDPRFVSNLALVARKDFHLRKVFAFLVTELAKNHKGDSLVSQTIEAGVERPDDCFSLLAFGTSFKSNQIKKGVATAFGRFNEYQLGKYKLAGSSRFKNARRTVGLIDAFNVSHPTPPSGKGALFARVVNDELKVPETWETVISGKGSTAANWEAIAPKMPYMATLRNIRNLLDVKVDSKTVDLVIEKITNPEAIKRSKQFPYRFYSAFKSIEETGSLDAGRVMDGIERAMELSVENIPKFKGTTFMSADNSGSMMSPVSEKSKISMENIANLMMSMAARFNERAITSIFGDDFKVKQMPSSSGIIANMQRIKNAEVGTSTNAWLAIDYLINNKIDVDRILIFSDGQCYNTYQEDNEDSTGRNSYSRSLAGTLSRYRKNVNPDVFVYSFDLKGYGTAQFSPRSKNILTLAGWSDKVFQLMQLAERKATLVDYISNYKGVGTPSDEESETE